MVAVANKLDWWLLAMLHLSVIDQVVQMKKRRQGQIRLYQAVSSGQGQVATGGRFRWLRAGGSYGLGKVVLQRLGPLIGRSMTNSVP